MKQFKLALVLLIAVAFTSCSDEGEASIEKSLVVEQVKSTGNSGCQSCLESAYSYRVKLKTHTGSVYYYTNYKHEVGDTLLSIFEFTDSRDGIIKTTEAKLDSVTTLNAKTQKKNAELELYNSLLMNIIQENAIKSN
jgi:hypothetical protein